MRMVIRILAALCWLINVAALAGYLLLRKRNDAPVAGTNKLRFHIIRPYITDNQDPNNEVDELALMYNLFRTAQEYGNAHVVVVTNNGDPGLDKIRNLAAAFAEVVDVVEAPPMPPNTISGQMFNHKVGWAAIDSSAHDEDVLLTTDCDSDLTTKLLYQIAYAYEDPQVGGVGTHPIYVPAVNVPAAAYTMAITPSVGFLALYSAILGTDTMPGNLLSMRVGLFRGFGGYQSYSPIEQLVDDVATSKKVLAAGTKLALVGQIKVYNRYASWSSWWQRWSRMTKLLHRTAPALFWPSPLPTYGGQIISEALVVYSLVSKQRRFALPFLASWGINLLYGSLSGAWRDALLSPLTAWLNLAGWLSAITSRSNKVRWRGLEFEIEEQ